MTGRERAWPSACLQQAVELLLDLVQPGARDLMSLVMRAREYVEHAGIRGMRSHRFKRIEKAVPCSILLSVHSLTGSDRRRGSRPVRGQDRSGARAGHEDRTFTFIEKALIEHGA